MNILVLFLPKNNNKALSVVWLLLSKRRKNKSQIYFWHSRYVEIIFAFSFLTMQKIKPDLVAEILYGKYLFLKKEREGKCPINNIQ